MQTHRVLNAPSVSAVVGAAVTMMAPTTVGEGVSSTGGATARTSRCGQYIHHVGRKCEVYVCSETKG